MRFDPVGGMQSHCGQLSQALDRLGIRQTIVTTWRPATPRIEAFGENGRLLRLGLPIATARQMYALPAWSLLPRLAEKADLLHAHLGEDLAVVPLALHAARHARIPFVLTVHCSPRHTVRGRTRHALLLRHLGGVIEKYGTKRAGAVIVLTMKMRDALLADGVAPECVHVIPSGIGPGFLSSRATRSPLLDAVPEPRVLYVGRLHEQKGVDILLRALTRLDDLSVHLLLLGDGPRGRALRDLAASLGVADRTHFQGFVPHEEIPGVLGGGDPLVLPSRYEELGTVLLEAMHSGNPVIATRVGGIPEIVQDGVTGLLVPPGQPEPLAVAIQRMLDDAILAKKVTTAARRGVEDLRWDRLVHRVLSVYAGLPGHA